ncbi:MAG: sugar phosphate nucleotidyltransferase [Candidatus Thermoplasmatota archaeon]
MADKFLDDDSKCVVLCAGEGTRLRPHSEKIPKVLLPVDEKPILDHIVDYWSEYTDDFVFVVGYKKEQVIDFAQQLPINAEFVEQKELKGIADALTYTEDLVDDRFMVVLGDCLIDGQFEIPQDIKQGIGVLRTDEEEEIKQNYSVEIEEGSISKVVEKPTDLVNDLCGMGVYLFQKKLFDYIPMTPPSERTNNVEITDVIQTMIDHDEEISPLFFDGKYINVNTPEDLEKAQKRIFSE